MQTLAAWKSCVVATILAGALAATACDSNEKAGNASSSGGPAVAASPLYALMTQVYAGDDRTVYVALSTTLDIGAVDITKAREFPGVANLAAVGGRLLISSGIEPKITEFSISDDLQWTEGRSVSFAQYELTDNANFYYQFVVDANNAVLPYAGTKRIVWDPTEMVIKTNLEDTTLTPSEGTLVLDPGGNRNGVQYDSAILQAFFYHDNDWFSYGSKSHLISYNPGTFTERKVLDVACPGLTLGTRDEQGNTYFGNWGLPSASIKGAAAATCVAKVSANHEAVETFDVRPWTGGRWVDNFRYIGNGKAIGNVLHHEALGVASPTELTDLQLSELGNDGPHWKLWLLDVNTKSGVEVQGIDMPISSGAQTATLDGRTFVFVPFDKWGRTKAYEIGADGKATFRFESTGDVFKWIKVR